MDSTQPARFSALAPGARRLWAKSGDPQGHGLLAHMLDVAAMAEAILLHEPLQTRLWAAQAFGLAPEQVCRWVAALVGLHDFGKAVPGFQAKWPDGQCQAEAAGLTFHGKALLCQDHARSTAALLGVHLQRLSGAEPAWCARVIQAISAHHGYHFKEAEIADGKPMREPPEWGDARRALVEAYWAVLAPQGRPQLQDLSLPTVNWLAGLTSVADWGASNPDWFPMGERFDELIAHHRNAHELARNALAQMGWPPYQLLRADTRDVDKLVADIVQRPGLEARALQREGHRLLQSARGPALLLVEAPMGEGKTELAFLAHLHLQAANQHRGLYMALPTQATGNALFRRSQTFLNAFAPGRLDPQLVHGGASMNRGLATLRDIDQSPHETLSASAWFGQRRRPLLSPYGVGTVDQALYAVLNVKHHFVRLWGLSNRVVVLDEVHAYDLYTLGLITTLLRWLKALGCSVILMSATLPAFRRRELLEAWGGTSVATTLDYPRLALVDAAGVRECHVAARSLAPIELHGLGSSTDEMAELALARVAEGGCGALIVNTVGRAQALYRRLQSCLAEAGQADEVSLLLFHARFPADDRGRLEDEVLRRFGAGGGRPVRALLVATQVAEQSLDIDFDFMLSDLAPVDLLLQRAGRLHRHARPDRPAAHAQARLWVAGLLPDQLPELKQTGWGFVYEPYILGRTWALLTQETVLQLPQDIDRLVQSVYDADWPLPDRLDASIRAFIDIKAYGEHLAELNVQRQQALNIALDPEMEPQLAYGNKPKGHEEDEVGLGLRNTTRLGPESITLVPVLVGEDGRWHVRPGDDGFLPDQPLSTDMARALYERQVKMTRRGVVTHFQSQPNPASFDGHPLLRHARPLPLVAGRYAAAEILLLLSDELGLMLGED